MERVEPGEEDGAVLFKSDDLFNSVFFIFLKLEVGRKDWRFNQSLELNWMWPTYQMRRNGLQERSDFEIRRVLS